MKCCKGCGLDKDLTEFSPHGEAPDGLHPRCKACRNAYSKATYQNRKARLAETNRAWREANPEARKRLAKKYYDTQDGREKGRVKAQRWRANNPAKAAEACRLRDPHRSSRRLTASKEAILAVYERARLLTLVTGVKHHVDHIVPLKGKTVSGLHVPWNLQCLPAQDNWSKSNTL